MNGEISRYREFLDRKRRLTKPSGFDVPANAINPKLFPFQRDIVRWALRLGKAAIFLDTGLGKTGIQTTWADHVYQRTRKNVLLLAPLAVGRQTLQEAAKFNVVSPIQIANSQDGVKPGINITNYQKLHRFDPDEFGAVVLDECFPAGTMIDVFDGDNLTKKDIKEIQPGDSIFNCTGRDSVVAVKRTKVSHAVNVFIAGSKVTCSPNHPFFTERGWIGASQLRPGDSVLRTEASVRMVRQPLSSEASIRSGRDATLLQHILLSEMANASAATSCESSQRRSCGEAREVSIQVASIRRSESPCRARKSSQSQSTTEPGSSSEDFQDTSIDWSQAKSSRRKRNWNDQSPVGLACCPERRLAARGRRFFGAARGRLSDLLQARSCEPRANDWDRIGWTLPPSQRKEGDGHKEEREALFARVEGIEILELGHPELDQYRDADGSLYFYDIQAARHPSFSVEGCLVHNSSIIKNCDGKTRTKVLSAFAQTPYRLACTATPAPNDQMELGNHAEFVGVMSRTEMLSMFFVHDGGDTSKWRLKGHAENEFWKWMAGWSVAIRKPSDIGYANDGYDLPPLTIHEHVVEDSQADEGFLFPMDARTLGEQRASRRRTISERVQVIADMANAGKDAWVVWSNLNDEAKAAAKAIQNCVEICGADKDYIKEEKLIDFAEGRYKRLSSKGKICGHGLNWQFAHKMAFIGIDHSWEMWKQAIARCYRFGQKHPVDVHVAISDRELVVLDNVKRKGADADKMAEGMIEHMREISSAEIRGTTKQEIEYNASRKMVIPSWLRSLNDPTQTKTDGDVRTVRSDVRKAASA